MKQITFLMLIFIPSITFGEILFGVMEESYLINRGNLQARILFSSSGKNEWHIFDKENISYPTNKLTWTVAFDGKNLGEIKTTETDSAIDYDKTFTYASRHKIDNIKKTPIIKNKKKRFGGWMYTPKNRPLILVTKPHFKDSEKWKRVKLKDDDKNKYTPHLKKLITTAYHCNGAPKYDAYKIAVENNNLEFFKAYQNKHGEKLVSIGIASHHIKECESPDQIALEPHWFYVSNTIQHIGKNIDLIDIGDYDGDNQVEYLFWYSGYNRDGYILFENHFSDKITYSWGYH